MDPPPKPSTALFDVYLRLRPSPAPGAERFLDVEETEQGIPTYITIKPPATDHRKRAVEKFAFTKVFEEDATQLDIFRSTGVLPLIDGVLGAEGREGRDGLLATLGVTGSGKSHTILGSKSQRGLIQMTLDALFQSTGALLVDPSNTPYVLPSLAISDVSEAQILPASAFLDSLYGDGQSERGISSRAQTPMLPAYIKDNTSFLCLPPPKRNNTYIPRPSTMPQCPSVDDLPLPAADRTAEYAIFVSMYEVYNDRIFDLLTGSVTATAFKNGQSKRRALLFKSTEQSPDRKVVAGLKKIVCASLEEALMVLETGLVERKVAGTGSNAVSSRSHGFFCVEVKKRRRVGGAAWSSSTLTVVDLAGSERARNAKTAGATLAEAGKINESLMYLGQCMQMQSDAADGGKTIVPFRQCKLTELLFSNSFPTTSSSTHSHNSHHHRSPQKSIMIVTADAHGDFNATSQILRYSALAREVTVPRVPSVTSTILNAPSMNHYNGRSSPTTAAASLAELEAAAVEIDRLNEEVSVLSLQLKEETARRQAAESSWRAAEARMEDVEAEVRETVYAEFEAVLAREQVRWRVAWEDEAGRKEEMWDAKIDILAREFGGVGAGDEDKENEKVRELDGGEDEDRAGELETENEALRRKVEMLEREMRGRTPSKKMRVLKARKWEVEGGLSGSP
ncbi:hypothetical protein W97_03845 [Coniosporium apollinis CBS 100218]|uniref:Kinesin-like protein n=1 Tax=Coniosporium apollinis (strain CBS 100218) TaxID=1168221 RepID=R7YRT1_CONA1|nr:uncharacterized protein W97_03845 [Coniosporium apollinis CBS 100218]EON64612.1 hypothetical protein W97_03845 [Coniosporium apollinis CBS 100218]